LLILARVVGSLVAQSMDSLFEFWLH
jgi:hypothetical protein